MASVCLKRCIYWQKKTENPYLKKYTNIFESHYQGLQQKYFISAKYEMYNKALSLYFIPSVASVKK